MNQTIEAVYGNRVFRPLSEVFKELKEGAKVKITVKREDQAKKSDPDLTKKYFKGLSEEDIDEVITHALDQVK